MIDSLFYFYNVCKYNNGVFKRFFVEKVVSQFNMCWMDLVELRITE